MSAPDARDAEAARIVEAVAAQRDLVARHLHDEAVQSMSVASLRVELVRAAVGPGVAEVEELREVLRSATVQLRSLMDSLRRPSVGDGELARSLRERLGSAHEVVVVDALEREPPEAVALTLHWTAEACVRELRHAHADGLITVLLRSPADAFVLEVSTELTGDLPRGVVGEPPESAARLAQMLGGSVTADASVPGTSRLIVRVPWGS